MKRLLTVLALVLSVTASAQSPMVVSNIAALKARKPIPGETVRVLGYRTPGDWGMPRDFTHQATNALTPNVGNTFTNASASGRYKAFDAEAKIQDARWWGAVGDGVTDDTASLQSAINAKPKVLSLFGTPLISQILLTNPIVIDGGGATLYQVTNVATNFIQIASPGVELRGLTLDGRRLAARGVRIDDGSMRGVIDSCTFTNFQEFATAGKITAVAVYINGGKTEWTISNCHFEDIYGLPDGIIGNPSPGTGFAHGVYINREFGSGSGTNRPILFNIERCFFKNILPGEDSDAIRWTDSGWTYDDIHVNVEKCYFEDIGKSACKFSGSGGRMVDCDVTNSFDGSFQASGWVDVGGYKEQLAVVRLYGRNHFVDNVRYNGGRIHSFFGSTVEASGCNIGNNTMRLSQKWGLNGLSVTNSGLGTIFGEIYLSSDMRVHDNYAEVVQFGVQVFSASTNITLEQNTFIGLATTNNLVEASSTNGWGRGIRIGRYSTNYPAGPVVNTRIIANTLDNFGAGIDLSESSNTVIAANVTNRLNRPIVVNATDPDGNSYPEHVQISGGMYGALTLLRPLELHTAWADTLSTSPNRRGQVIYDTADQALSWFNGRDWVSPDGATRRYTVGTFTNVFLVGTNYVTNAYSVLSSNSWWRVAECNPIGYTARGTARITIGSGGGSTSSSAEFVVGMNFTDPTIFMVRNFAKSLGGSTPVCNVRLVRNGSEEKTWFEFQPTADLYSLVGVTVLPDWTTQAGVDPTNAWRATPFTNGSAAFRSGVDSEILTLSNLTTSVEAYASVENSFKLGQDTFELGTNRFKIDSPPTSVDTPITMVINGAAVRVKRDPTTGALFTGSYGGAALSHTHDASDIVSGVLNVARVGTSSGNATNYLNGLGAFVPISAGSSYTFSTGTTNSGGTVTTALAAGANVTFSTNAQTITISATGGGGGGPTNGTSVAIDGVAVTQANFADSAEINPTYSGTNVTLAIVPASIQTNKLDATAYAWINGKQSALTFSTGTTNAGGTVTAALAPGSGIAFSTNAQTIIVANSLTFTNGLTNVAGVVQAALIAGTNVTISTNAGAITISASGGGGGGSSQTTSNIAQRIGWAKFRRLYDATGGAPGTSTLTEVSVGGVITNVYFSDNLVTNYPSLQRVNFQLSGVADTNYFPHWSLQTMPDPTLFGGVDNWMGIDSPRAIGASWGTTNFSAIVGDNPGATTYGGGGTKTTNWHYLSLFRLVDVASGTVTNSGGSGSPVGVNSGAGGSVTNFADSASLGWSASSGTATANSKRRMVATWTAAQQVPVTNAAAQAQFTLLGNGIPYLTLDGATAQGSGFRFVVPPGYDWSGGAEIQVSALLDVGTGAASNCVFQVQYQNLGPGGTTVTNQSYAGAVLTTNAFPGAPWVQTNITINATGWTGFTAGQNVLLDLQRVPGSASDDNSAAKVYVGQVSISTVSQ